MSEADEVVEELQKKYNTFLIDQFYSTEQLTEALTGTGAVSRQLFELKLQTGISAASTAKLYYNLNRFNPHYSKAWFRVRLNDIADTFAFFGFKKSWADPAFAMTESHSGVMISGGKAYLSTANELGAFPNQQRTQFTDIDLTRDFIFKIEKNKLSTMPLPQIVPYFDTFRIISPDRFWKLKVTNSTHPPEDLTHYMMFFISNTTNDNKEMTLRHFCYLEEYAD